MALSCRRLLLVLFFILSSSIVRPLCAQISPAQSAPETAKNATATTRTIQGRVLDPNGQPVANAIVLIKNLKTLEVRSYLAGNDGTYHFYGMSSEVNFNLRAQANGLSSKEKTVNVFDSHRVVILDLKLQKPKKKKIKKH